MPSSLTEHALVLDHVQPSVIGFEDEARRKPIRIQGAANHQGQQTFSEVPYACGCGAMLHADPARVRRAWAVHTAVETGLDADHLERHALRTLSGEPATVGCGCGHRFGAPAKDPADPGLAIALWAKHVEKG
jgi:hypothetical protein